jgi:hypothetical protein
VLFRSLITELRDYGFKPSEDIVSTDTKKGLVVKEGPESLTDLVDKCPNIGEYIEKVEASYEELRIASLTEEEWLVHNFPELKDII